MESVGTMSYGIACAISRAGQIMRKKRLGGKLISYWNLAAAMAVVMFCRLKGFSGLQ